MRLNWKRARVFNKCFQSTVKQISVDNNNRLWKTTEYYGRVREYRKEKLDNISRQLEIFVCSSKRSRVWKSRSADKYEYWKELWNMNQLENIKEKSPEGVILTKEVKVLSINSTLHGGRDGIVEETPVHIYYAYLKLT